MAINEAIVIALIGIGMALGVGYAVGFREGWDRGRLHELERLARRLKDGEKTDD